MKFPDGGLSKVDPSPDSSIVFIQRYSGHPYDSLHSSVPIKVATQFFGRKSTDIDSLCEQYFSFLFANQVDKAIVWSKKHNNTVSNSQLIFCSPLLSNNLLNQNISFYVFLSFVDVLCND